MSIRTLFLFIYTSTFFYTMKAFMRIPIFPMRRGIVTHSFFKYNTKKSLMASFATGNAISPDDEAVTEKEHVDSVFNYNYHSTGPFYITTPIYYVNGNPHLGHAYTSVSADVIARFNRNDGRNVLFLTGTDEHGQKVQQSSALAGIAPKEFADQMSDRFRTMTEELGCSHDRYIRTTEEDHVKAVQALWKILEDRGYIYLSSYDGWYSVRDEAFYDESELVNGKAPTGAPVEWVKEESYFFRLSAFTKPLLDFYANNPSFIEPPTKLAEMVAFVGQSGGLHDLSISRTTFTWGVPVPGNPKHVVYVWLDALANYLTAAGFPDVESEKFRTHWPPKLQIVGKDILRFHAVYWPAFLMAAGLPLPEKLFAHGWWTRNGEKMSKSVGNVIDPMYLIESYGKDYLRYYLVAEVPFGYDGNFTVESFIHKLNSELANDIGNLVQRVFSMAHNYCGGVIPEPETLLTTNDRIALHRSVAALVHCRMHIQKLNLKGVCEEIVGLANVCNKYLDVEAPWKLRSTNPARVRTIIFVMANNVRRIAILLSNVLPTSATNILDQMSTPPELRTFASFGARTVAGLAVPAPSPIFPKLVYEPSLEDFGQPKPVLTTPVMTTSDTVNQLLEELGSKDALVQSLSMKIDSVGSRIRELKSAKKAKSDLKPFVDELLQLKEQLKVAQQLG